MKDKRDFDTLYQEWIKEEKQTSDQIFQSNSEHRTSKIGKRSLVTEPAPGLIRGHRSLGMIAAVAILVLALSATLVFKPFGWFEKKYTQQELQTYYKQSVTALAICANSIKTEMESLETLKKLSEPFDKLKNMDRQVTKGNER